MEHNLKIENCICGREASLDGSACPPYYVSCHTLPPGGNTCWYGPNADTPEEAVKAWNKGMIAMKKGMK